MVPIVNPKIALTSLLFTLSLSLSAEAAAALCSKSPARDLKAHAPFIRSFDSLHLEVQADEPSLAEFVDWFRFHSFYSRLCAEPAGLRQAKKYRLTIPEWITLNTYTTDALYQRLNAALRSNSEQARETYAFATRAIETAMAKMPLCEGPVYRWVNLPAEIDVLYQPGAIVSDAAFLSTSEVGNLDEEEVDPSNYGSRSHEIRIECQTGRRIGGVSSIEGEREVLFPRGTRFEVVSRRTGGRHRVVLELREVPRS